MTQDSRLETGEEATVTSCAQRALNTATEQVCEVPSFQDFSDCFSADVPDAYRNGMYEQYSKLMASLQVHGFSASRLTLQQPDIQLELKRMKLGASTTGLSEACLRAEIDKGNQQAQDIDAQVKAVEKHLQQMREKMAALQNEMGLDSGSKLDPLVDASDWGCT